MFYETQNILIDNNSECDKMSKSFLYNPTQVSAEEWINNLLRPVWEVVFTELTVKTLTIELKAESTSFLYTSLNLPTEE